MSERSAIGRLMFMTGGLLVWAAHFAFLYGFTSTACAAGFAAADIWGTGIVPFVAGAATLLAWTASGAIFMGAVSGPVPPRSVQYANSTESFLRYTTAVLAFVSLIAVAWGALPVLVFPPC
ncbi:MAG: hypothetical protein ACREV8_18000 [Gammaproteobacteria bacterium]